MNKSEALTLFSGKELEKAFDEQLAVLVKHGFPEAAIGGKGKYLRQLESLRKAARELKIGKEWESYARREARKLIPFLIVNPFPVVPSENQLDAAKVFVPGIGGFPIRWAKKELICDHKDLFICDNRPYLISPVISFNAGIFDEIRDLQISFLPNMSKGGQPHKIHELVIEEGVALYLHKPEMVKLPFYFRKCLVNQRDVSYFSELNRKFVGFFKDPLAARFPDRTPMAIGVRSKRIFAK